MSDAINGLNRLKTERLFNIFPISCFKVSFLLGQTRAINVGKFIRKFLTVYFLYLFYL